MAVGLNFRHRLCCYVAMAVSLLSCSVVDSLRQTNPPATVALGSVPYRVLHKADYNIDDSVTTKAFTGLTSAGDYSTELARYSVEVPANIDFLTSQVLASTMGTQPSGGYVIGVTQAEEFTDKVIVTVTLLSPGESCVTTQAISNPYEFALLETTKPVEVVEVEQVLDCS